MNSLRQRKFDKLARSASACAATLLLLLPTLGCRTSTMVADLIATAPNAQGTLDDSNIYTRSWNDILSKATNRTVVYVNVPVGPPLADLSVLELPPQDYHVKVQSYVTNEHKHTSFTMTWNSEPANTFTPLAEPRTIFLLHGYALNKESMLPWAAVLTQAGYRVIVVDLRGHGHSTGDQITFGKYETTDLSQVLDYLTQRQLSEPEVGVLGISYGADLALHWAARDSRVRAVVAIAPYNQPVDAMERLAKEMNLHVSHAALVKGADLAATSLDLQWSDWSGAAALARLQRPVLLVGAGKDTISRPDDIQALLQAAPSGSKRIVVPQANHFEVGYWFHELAGPVKAWFGEQLATAEKPASDAGSGKPNSVDGK